MRIDPKIYELDAVCAAPKFLGKLLCRNISGEIIKLRITETESYFGEDDTACHASKGKTARTQTLYEPGGVAYIYLCYGIHHLLNFVTGEKDFPQAVLIRGVEGFGGPGKLTKRLGINKSLNGESLVTSDEIWVEDDGFTCAFATSRRVGIDYATEEYKNKPWRFILVEGQVEK